MTVGWTQTLATHCEKLNKFYETYVTELLESGRRKSTASQKEDDIKQVKCIKKNKERINMFWLENTSHAGRGFWLEAAEMVTLQGLQQVSKSVLKH